MNPAARTQRNTSTHTNTASNREHVKAVISNYLIAFAFVVSATTIFVFCRRWLDDNEASLFYLPVVMACAVRLGFGAAIFAAMASFLSWDYFFLAPYHTLAVDSQSSLISLSVFAITAVTTARLAARVREQAYAARLRERDMATLLKASELVSSAVDSDETLENLVREACRSYDSTFAAILELQVPDSIHIIANYGDLGSVFHAETQIAAQSQHALRENKVIAISPDSDSLGFGIYAPIYHLGEALGVLFVRIERDQDSLSNLDFRLLTTLASHAAVVIARKRATKQSQTKVRENAILDERRRLAQEVHDSLSNTFNSIKFLLEAARRTDPDESSRECMDMALKLAVDGAQEARHSVWSLRPVVFEDSSSLAVAIRRLTGLRAATDQSAVNVDVIGEPSTIDQHIEDNFYRIAQEAVSNALRHAHAKSVDVTLTYTLESLELTVKDNGIGFDKAAYVSNGMGIENIASRSKSMAAEFKLFSEIGEGTTVNVKVDL